MVGIAPFGASPPSWGGDGSLNGVVVGKARAHRVARRMNVIRHPEVRAQRASKGDGPGGASAAPFEARLSARTSG